MEVRTHFKKYMLGHVEIYDDRGRFVVSGDNDIDADNNLIEILTMRERAAQNNDVA